ncbi:MAG: Mitochondrial intermediate peptidase [Cirrosporium novae-zelandiae]|nr:MAG: Mitochondrial intermediate peptidase [Cirrosporium novae-zelandiae]
MLHVLSRQPWICRRCFQRCLQKQKRFQAQRNLSFVAPAPSPQSHFDKYSPLVEHGDPEESADDRTLRLIFDSPSFWKEFSQRKSHVSGKLVGLVHNHYLINATGFEKFAEISLRKCRRLVRKILAASTIEEYRNMAKDFDRLSDLLCRVIDLSDFLRANHPDRKIQQAAAKAWGLMYEYMNILNTTTALHDQLEKALNNPKVTKHWSQEELVVARILWKDFSRAAIHMPAADRQKFVDLSNEISQLGTDFVEKMEPSSSSLSFDSSRLQGMDPMIVKKLSSRGKVILPTVGPVASLALRAVEDEEIRKEIYIANRSPSETQIQRLELLMTKRMELARLSGYQTFAEHALSDKMAKTPKAVDKFLKALAADNGIYVQQELEQLQRLKQETAGRFTQINAWDRDFYMSRLLARSQSKDRYPDFLSSYFSLGSVMQGLSRLFSRLYGIRFVPHELSPGETWNSDVRRLDVISEVDGHIAVVYCDLFEREGKNPNPAHFTLRCSRLITPSEIHEATLDLPNNATMTPEEAANDGMPTTTSPDDSLYQLPTIALICDFARPQPSYPLISPKPRPTLLTFHEVRTLFHEMGHAVHSMLGRTALQNVSGTRCATDFAELPSIFNEHFASNPSVLALFARHYETDKPLPYALIQEKLDRDKLGQGSETEAQILMALLDQAFHSIAPSPWAGAPPLEFNSRETYKQIIDTYGSIPEPPHTAWYGFFGHLYGYGATYYSYLFDRAIAGKVWKEVFMKDGEDGVVSREKGERLKEEVLKWGGGRDGWECVGGVLGDEALKEGGEDAMKRVGEWGVRD